MRIRGGRKCGDLKKKLEKIEKLTDHDRGNKLSGSGSRIILTRKKIGLGSPSIIRFYRPDKNWVLQTRQKLGFTDRTKIKF